MTTPKSRLAARTSAPRRREAKRFTSNSTPGCVSRKRAMSGNEDLDAGLVRADHDAAALHVLEVPHGPLGFVGHGEDALGVVLQRSPRFREAGLAASCGRRGPRRRSDSRRRTAWLTADCVRKRRTAAREKLRSSATVRKTRREKMSISRF